MSGTVSTPAAPTAPTVPFPAPPLPVAGFKVYSPSQNSFYATELEARYRASGSWPADGIHVADAVWQEFIGNPPAGKTRGQIGGVPGWVEAPPPPALTLAQEAQNLLGLGLEVESASVPTLSGVYAATPDAVAFLQSEMLSVIVAGVYLDGTDTLEIADTLGTLHACPIAVFRPFALAVAAFVSAVGKVISGSATSLPATAASII
jgi:hypothetical protein